MVVWQRTARDGRPEEENLEKQAQSAPRRVEGQGSRRRSAGTVHRQVRAEWPGPGLRLSGC